MTMRRILAAGALLFVALMPVAAETDIDWKWDDSARLVPVPCEEDEDMGDLLSPVRQ